MKKLVAYIIGVFVITLLCCETPVIFTRPQPEGFMHKNNFSIFYRGSYFCESDSSIVYISDKIVFKKKEYSFVIPRAAIDTMSNIRLVDDRIQINKMEEWIPARVIGDQVHAQLTKRDTLFEIGEDRVLTIFRGHQILNQKRPDGYWEVAILSLDEDMNVTLSMAAEPEDLDRLKEITPVTDLSRGDTIQYLISPTIDQFNQILEEELVFKELEYYTRIAALIEM